MCGIAGRVNVFSLAPVDPATVRRMCSWIRHRGPDDEGVHVDAFAGLGHRRLAVIDLSPAGHQPMPSENGRYWITFNGEIYNYRELRRRLESEGHRFRTNTDTEVLLAAYERYGAACLDLVVGMFAFAIWDKEDRRLFLARDRVGKKPLYYRVDEDGLAFASESKAFLAESSFEPRPNAHALSAYLSLQYVPAPHSAFDGVHQLPPAHYLIATASGVETHRYWQLSYEPKRPITEAEAEEALLDHLREAVRARLASDVPLGAFLSGGVDSGVVVALMCELGGQAGAVRTFSIGFDDREFNELPYARRVAERYRTEHHEFVVQPDIQDVVPRLVAFYGEPFADSSAVPTFYLSEVTRRHVTVALNGDGGDENFAGYDRYAQKPRNAAYARLPRSVRAPVASLATRLPAAAAGPQVARVRRWAQFHALSADRRAIVSRMLIDPETRADLCTPEFLAAAGDDGAARHLAEAYERALASEDLDRQLSLDLETYLPGALLPKVDIATMAFGLEGRSPLLDHRVLEFTARLPVDMKRRGPLGKRLLKRVAKRLLPSEVTDRPKRGFSLPLARWFRTDLAAMLADVLLGTRCRQRGLLNPVAVERLVREHAAGTHDWNEQLWILLMLELWCQSYLDARMRPDALVPLAGAASSR